MNRLIHPSQSQIIALGVLLTGVGAVFSPPLQVVAQPATQTAPANATTMQATGTPQPLATPPAPSPVSPGVASLPSTRSMTTQAVGTITGTGTTGNIAKFAGANTIGNSALYETGGKVGLGTTTPTGVFSVNNGTAGVYGIYSASTGNGVGGTSSGAIGVYGLHTASTGAQSGVLGETHSTADKAIGTAGVILSTSPGAGSAGVRGINNGTGGNGYGVYGSHAGSGTGVYGMSASGNGVIGQSSSSTGVSGVSVSGFGAAGQSTNNYGVYAESSQSYGVYGISSQSNGVYGTASNAAGVYGISSQSDGVYGTASNAAGVHGYSAGYSGVRGDSSGGEGITGVSSTGSGVVGTGSIGVRGNANSSSGYADGVQGVAFSSNSNSTGIEGNDGNGGNGPAYAGYFYGKVYIQGNLTVTGTVAKSAGSFKIDHPLHPATEYLSHSFVESPDMMNVYNGNTKTNAKGEAWVQMPNYFQALNSDFRYQLTPMGQFAQAIVGKKISGNRFLIRTDKPNVEVSWQVTGVRHDAYARQHRIRVEETKTGADRGKYLYPAGFGFGKDKQIGAEAIRLTKR